MPQINVYYGPGIIIDGAAKHNIANAIMASVAEIPEMNSSIGIAGVDIDFLMREYAGDHRKVTIFILGLFEKPDRTDEVIGRWSNVMHRRVSSALLKHNDIEGTLEIVPIMANPNMCFCERFGK